MDYKFEESKNNLVQADSYDLGEEVIVWIPAEFQLGEESEDKIAEEPEEDDTYDLEHAILLRANGDESVLQRIYEGLTGLNAQEAVEFVKLGQFKLEMPKGPFTIIRDGPAVPKQANEPRKRFVYYPLTRFAPIFPRADEEKYRIYISPAYDRTPFGPLLTANELCDIAAKIQSCKDLVVAPIEAQEAVTRCFYRIGENFLGYFDTWMDLNDYTYMRTARQEGGWWREPLIDQTRINILKDWFKKVPVPLFTTATETALSVNKPLRAVGKRQGVKSQKAVMGNVSATRVANLLWKAQTKEKGFQDAEWLHRSGFALGGLGLMGDDYDLHHKTSQTAENLIFGTSECNTHMLRAEMDILRVLSWAQTSPDLDDSKRDTITASVSTVVPKDTSPISTVDGVPEKTAISPKIPVNPKLKEPEQLPFWLVPALDYAFVVNLPGVQPWGTATRFNAFSRYRPTRFEAQLDQLVFEHAMKAMKAMAQQNPGGGITIRWKDSDRMGLALKMQELAMEEVGRVAKTILAKKDVQLLRPMSL